MRVARPAPWAILLVTVAACLGDPVGPGVMVVAIDGAGPDTVWSGAPGEALPRIRIHVRDDAGHAIPAATVTWETAGQRSGVASVVAETNALGEASAVWTLGTDAAEEQRLRVTVQTRRSGAELTVRARAVPNVVVSVRVAADSVVRVGDTLALQVDAVDPYGNVFPAPDVVTFVSDTTVGSPAGSNVIGGPRRGRGFVLVTSHTVAATVPLHVTQYVAAITPVRDTLVFSALGAQLPVTYIVRDDRGREVLDTAAALSITDTAVVRLTGTQLQSLRPGAATLQFALGPASASVPLLVDQRIASLRLGRDTIRFDALLDTTTLRPLARDSLGAYVVQPAVVFQIQDDQVAVLSDPTLLRAVTPGVTIVTVRDPVTGITASVPVVVSQVVRTIDVSPVAFDALGDTLTPAVTPRDRLSHQVADAVLAYSVSDSSVVQVEPSGKVHSATPGHATLTVRDEESGATATIDVTVQQRVTSLVLDVDTVAFDAFEDTVGLSVVGRDRLGALVSDAAARTTYSSTDPAVAVVDGKGRAHSAGNGSALVVAQSTDGAADTVRVTVVQRVVGVAVDRDSVVFESLHAEQSVVGIPLDRRGVPVASATVFYSVVDPTIASVDAAGRVRALQNGSTRVIAASDEFTVAADIRIAQRAVRVAVPRDTIHLAALEDTATISGVALDSLGSPVAGVLEGLVVPDTVVVSKLDSVTVRARANGATNVTFSVAGAAGSTVVEVRQIARTLTAALTDTRPIVTLPLGGVLPVECHGFDANGFATPDDAVISSNISGTASGSCTDVRVTRSGFDTLVFSSGTAQARVAAVIAVGPVASSALGTNISIAFPGASPGTPWAPSLRRNEAGALEVYYGAFSLDSGTGLIRADLHRFVGVGGTQFVYDGIAIAHEDSICNRQGQGIENMVIMPRADGIGLRMLYAAGSNLCYGWQVFSAVSMDGRTWTKEDGIRLPNGNTSPLGDRPWPTGEGMQVFHLPDGTWQLIAGTFERVTPAPVNEWAITEWRSADQLDWTYVGPVLTVRDMPVGWQGSVYSPTIREFAPGLWRMIFTADDRRGANNRSALWSAVSTDRVHWQVEKELLGATGFDLYYSALVDDQLVFVRKPIGGAFSLAIATVTMP